jgi:hypothetical protein
MNNRSSFAITVAIAGTLSTAALPLDVACADEMSDLRANNQLLQQRLDQLAQIPAPGSPYPGGPPAATAGQGIVGGSFPRSFLIPGTDTSLRVGGQITEIVDYWLNGGNPNASPQNTTAGDNGQLLAIPLHFHPGSPGLSATSNQARDRSTSIFLTSPRESKLSIETRTPTAFGEARTFMEFDWAGSTAFSPGGGTPTSVSDNLAPRLRFAYGTLGGFLAGQANSNFSDPDSNTESIDFGGNVGEAGVVRIPQIRYTTPLAPYGLLGALSFSVETPETDAWIPVGGIIGSDAGAITGVSVATTTGVPATESPVISSPLNNPLKAKAPDLTMAWYIPQPWGHFDMSFVVRPGLQFKDGIFVDRSFVGYGGHFGFDVKPGWFGWAKDDITVQATIGDALGRYLNCSCNFALVSNYGGTAATAPPLTRAAASLVKIKATREYGGDIGYQHRWTDNIRSTFSVGYQRHDVDSNIALAGRGAINKELVSAHANVIWSPVSFVDFGAEYMYGHRIVINNLKGDENVLIGEFKVRF